MNNEELKVLHSGNRIRVIEKEYNGAETVISNAVNAPMDIRIYGTTRQFADENSFLESKLLNSFILKSTNNNKTYSTKIPFVGNAIEVTNPELSNVSYNGKNYVADYIEYNSKTNKASRYKFIDESLLEFNRAFKDQLQAILQQPIIEEIIMDDENYFFESIKSIQDKCKISLEYDNQFNFDTFVKLGGYSGIRYINLENEYLYEFIGDEEYLYYKVFIPYNDDYVFSYKTTGLGGVVVRFFDSQKNNISSKIENVIQKGYYDKIENGIITSSTNVLISYKEETDIAYFEVGFKVIPNELFSKLTLLKSTVNDSYMDLTVKSLKKTDFNFEEFVENGSYSGIEYVNTIEGTENLYRYTGDEEYLYYDMFIPYDSDYAFSYNSSKLGETTIRFYDKKKINISSETIFVLEGENYSEEQNGIKIESTDLIIPYIEGTEIAYFQVGFKVWKDGYFSNLCLKNSDFSLIT